SSTATALIVAAFAGQGLIGTAPALSVMLGADVGTALVTLVLSFDLSWLAPLLIFVGVVSFLTMQATRVGRFGRILIGLGLIMLSTLRSPPEARRVVLGNFLFRVIGCLLALPMVSHIETWIDGLALDGAREVVLFHLLFNVALAIIFVGLTEKIAHIAERVLPTKHVSDDPDK